MLIHPTRRRVEFTEVRKEGKHWVSGCKCHHFLFKYAKRVNLHRQGRHWRFFKCPLRGGRSIQKKKGNQRLWNNSANPELLNRNGTCWWFLISLFPRRDEETFLRKGWRTCPSTPLSPAHLSFTKAALHQSRVNILHPDTRSRGKAHVTMYGKGKYQAAWHAIRGISAVQRSCDGKRLQSPVFLHSGASPTWHFTSATVMAF